ncbi:MAG: dTDP-glucose 4,6-dehydratase [Lachnospiraceae bacterium]|nr:dTDP-glucose 4,6-dehydratase [Lachnospiraceae bacterium]
MNIIVTGGAGFIGSNFIFYLAGKYPDYRIICLDCLSYAGNLSTIEPLFNKPNFRFVKKSITDRNAVYKLFEEEHPDVVVNFAAQTHVDRSINDPEIIVETNINGTAVLLDACVKYGISRYHQVSTDEVYGELPLDRPDMFFTEDTPIRASSPYSASKASADLLVLAYHRTFGVPVTISRCSNNYGPYHFPEKLIPLMLIHAINDKPLPVYGTGENVRDWLYVEDHCAAIDLILQKGRVGEIYNIGGHNERRNIDVVKLILKALKKPESLITYVEDRRGHDLRYAIDPTKIHNELGWLPVTSFETGIKKTVQWFVANEEWWRPIVESDEYQEYREKMYGKWEVISAWEK